MRRDIKIVTPQTFDIKKIFTCVSYYVIYNY